MKETKQTDFWSGDFGKEYSKRNNFNQDEWDRFYLENWGITKISMNEKCIGHLPRDMFILEVGCNVGLQLSGLERMGFTNLYGIELQREAAEEARRNTESIHIIQGSGFDIPFKNGFFDLVFTSGVLIHIAPADLKDIMS